MTSEEIKNMQGAAANDCAKVVGKNDATYTAVMRNIYLAEIAYQLAVMNEKDPPGVARDGFHEQMIFRGEKALRVACRCGWSTDLQRGTQPEFANEAFRKHEHEQRIRELIRQAEPL